MSDERFEIAFSGQIIEGSDRETVKKNIGQIFKADSARLELMFSGRRVLIKREADEATAAKYRTAFGKAGAVCEVRSLSKENSNETEPPEADESGSSPYVSKYPESDQVPQALLNDPLGVSADSIQSLDADIAPVGSPMQHHITETPEPSFDLGGLEVAPVGSTLSPATKQDLPKMPDTSGLTLSD
jgi:hypothetical protein